MEENWSKNRLALVLFVKLDYHFGSLFFLLAKATDELQREKLVTLRFFAPSIQEIRSRNKTPRVFAAPILRESEGSGKLEDFQSS